MKQWLLLIILLSISNGLLGQFAVKPQHDHFCRPYSMQQLVHTKLASEKLDYYDVKFYKLDLEVNDTSTYLEGKVIVKTEIVTPSPDTFVLELDTMLTVDSVYINGNRHVFAHRNDLLNIALQNNYLSGDMVMATVYYHGVAGTGNNRGIFNQKHGQTGLWVTYTLSEPFGSKSWFPCKQDLKDKADSVEVHITVPSGLMAGSNGILQEVITLKDGKQRYEWKSNYPIAYYLISLAVTDYQDYSIWAKPGAMDGDSILIQNYVYNIPGLLDAYREDIDETVNMLNMFSDLYTLYPFHEEKYGHAMATFGGGMEHQTMTTILNFNFTLVAHELAHQWFGNNVTCATWQDIWINEGFASYSEYIALQELRGQEEATGWMENAHDRIVREEGGSIYVPLEDASNARRIFDYRLSYKKGAAIIHMLRFEINNDFLFYKTMQEFQIRFKDSVATGDDFKHVLEDITNKDWDFFFNQWYYGEGYPVYTINWDQSNDTLHIFSQQESSTDYPRLFESSLEFTIVYSDATSELKRVYQDETDETFSMVVPKKVSQIVFDPNLWLLKRISEDSYFKREQIKAKMEIYPNPVQDELTIDFAPPVDNWEIEVHALNGKMVYSQEVNTTNLTINVSSWENGVYTVKAGDGQNIITRKMVKASP